MCHPLYLVLILQDDVVWMDLIIYIITNGIIWGFLTSSAPYNSLIYCNLFNTNKINVLFWVILQIVESLLSSTVAVDTYFAQKMNIIPQVDVTAP